MKKNLRKALSIVLSVLMVFSCVAVAASAEEKEYIPSIVIPGIFQSEVKLYNKDGTLALNSSGEEYAPPFFLDSTAKIVVEAVLNAIYPISRLLITQEDKDNMVAETVAKVGGEIVFGKTLGVDENGEYLYDVKPTKYDTAVIDCSEYDQNYIYDQIPLQEYSEIAGAENLFFFSYYSFGSITQTAEDLYQFCQSVMEQTGSDKINIVPISQGGTLANALLAIHDGDIIEHLNRIVYIVPALDGANLVGQLYADGLADEDSMLYLEMFPKLFGEDQQWLAYLIDMVLRIMPNADVNNIIDRVVDELVGKYLKRSTLMWALCSSGYYPAAAEKYLSGDENAVYKAETDWYYNEAQLKSDENILKAVNAGVKVFDIVDYNSEVYALTEGYNDQNGDGIIHLDSTSMGATSFGVDVQLPEGYVLKHTNCDNPEHDHSDPWNLIDATTGLLPDTTFYFKDQNHERTAQNDVIIKLATQLLTDDSFVDVYSYPDKFPQFNLGRLAKGPERTLAAAKKIDKSALSEEQAAELQAAIDELEYVLSQTYVTVELNERLDKAVAGVDTVIAKIKNGGKLPDNSDKEKQDAIEKFVFDLLAAIFKFVATIFNKIFGGKGFSEIIYGK
ncbi:MAG: hypothetical protein MJ177_06400 [Clostridia bacterium]|nr:hypothetical protein [Clostridia bacterium]